MLNGTEFDDGEGISAEEDFRIKAASFLMFQIGWLMFYFFLSTRNFGTRHDTALRLFHTQLVCVSVLGGLYLKLEPELSLHSLVGYNFPPKNLFLTYFYI